MAAPAPWKVDPDVAGLVADTVLGAPAVAATPAVRAAYAQLAEEAGAWFRRLTASTGAAIRVVFTHDPEPYADADELATSVRTQRLLEVHSAAYEPDRRHPLLESTVGGAFDQLRAVHDILSHGLRRFAFDRDGEFSAWLAEAPLYSVGARPALATELHGQHSVLWTTGQVAELKATLLPPALLGDSRRRARCPFPTRPQEVTP